MLNNEFRLKILTAQLQVHINQNLKTLKFERFAEIRKDSEALFKQRFVLKALFERFTYIVKINMRFPCF